MIVSQILQMRFAIWVVNGDGSFCHRFVSHTQAFATCEAGYGNRTIPNVVFTGFASPKMNCTTRCTTKSRKGEHTADNYPI